jgi:hypothetical protein
MPVSTVFKCIFANWGHTGFMYSVLEEAVFASSPPSTRNGFPSTISCVAVPCFSRCAVDWAPAAPVLQRKNPHIRTLETKSSIDIHPLSLSALGSLPGLLRNATTDFVISHSGSADVPAWNSAGQLGCDALMVDAPRELLPWTARLSLRHQHHMIARNLPKEK